MTLATLTAAELDTAIVENRAQQKLLEGRRDRANVRTLRNLKAAMAELIAERNRRDDMQQLPL